MNIPASVCVAIFWLCMHRYYSSLMCHVLFTFRPHITNLYVSCDSKFVIFFLRKLKYQFSLWLLNTRSNILSNDMCEAILQQYIENNFNQNLDINEYPVFNCTPKHKTYSQTEEIDNSFSVRLHATHRPCCLIFSKSINHIQTMFVYY